MAITPSPVPRGPVTATLNFSHPPPPGVTAVNYVEDPPSGEPKRNLAINPQPVQINDIRGRESEFSLDHDAFLPIPAPAPANGEEEEEEAEEVNFDDETSITKTYYPQITALLLRHVPGATRVVLFDHTIRRASPTAKRGPVLLAHVDQTPKSVLQRIHRHLPEDEAAALLARGTRYRIINIWRSLNKNPVESSPLAFASSASFRAEDAIPVEHRYPGGYTGETAAVAHHPDQKWYYWSGMTPGERLLLECFDSASLGESGSTEVRGGRTPHTAFVDPRTRPDAEGRESIEVRALVFGP
ncbi:7alpha-cephem-methoxylase p8 chain related protein [Apiospora marii]|uniref:7alpha-cephem-methoxylase p8 chain related protein n=1 Tax=Apiospora marii TaxID=335849 RepID=A0ABR1RF44_9PEZI